MGIPLRVLLDKHDRFMPATISGYYRFLYERRHGRSAVHYHESETIWQAVSEATWAELETYLDAFVERSEQRWDEIQRNWSYNPFSAEVRDDWKDLWRRSQLDKDPLVYQIEECTGLCIHANRKWYIKWYNKKYRKPRRGWFRNVAPLLDFFHPGHLSNDEIKHLRKKGVHFGLDPVVGFEKVVDTRAEASTEVLGLPELLPDSKLAETAKAEDDLPKNGQHRTRTLSRL